MIAKQFLLGTGLQRSAALTLIAVLLLLWSAVIWNDWQGSEKLVTETQLETAALSQLFATETDNTFRAADHALRELRTTWINTPNRMGELVREYRDFLAGAIIQIGVIDSEGYAAYSDLGMSREQIFLGDREHFTVHQGSLQDNLFVSRPVMGKISGKWSIQLSRPIFRGGRFAGVVVISLDPNHLLQFYKQAVLGIDGEALMLRDTGEVMARSSAQEQFIGKVIKPFPFPLDQSGASQRGTIRSVSVLDGVERISSYYRLPQYRLTVLIGPSLQARLEPIRRHQRQTVLAATLLSVLVLTVAWQLLRAMERKEAGLRAMEQAAMTLRSAEEQYRLLAENSNDIVWHMNRSYQLDYVSPASLHLLGYTPSEMVGSTIEPFLKPEGRTVLLAQLAQVRAKRNSGIETDSIRYELEHLCKDGSWKWMEVIYGPQRDAGGTITGYQGVSRDISERKGAEQQLLLAASVFTHARESIMIADAQGTIVDVNDTFTQITGYSRQEAIGCNPRMLQSGRHTPAFYTELWQTLLKEGCWTGEIWNRRKNGEVYAEMQTLSVVRQGDSGTQHYLSLSTDITDLKEQQNLQNTNAHLHALAVRAQDVREEQNAHIAREIHDVLAQELTLVKIDLALLSRYLHTPVTETTRALLNERTADATRQVDQAIQTVKNIATALRPAILDSLGLFAAIGWLVEDFCKRSGLAFEVSVPEDTPMPDRKLSIALFRIVQECLTNVARHAKATKVTLRLMQSPESLTLTAQDDGCGISPTQTADKLSIGLAGMQERAMAFGGTFTVLGSPGAGTTVSVHIPMKEPT